MTPSTEAHELANDAAMLASSAELPADVVAIEEPAAPAAVDEAEQLPAAPEVEPTEVKTSAAGGKVVLERPFPFCALPRLWIWTEDFWHRVSDDFSPNNLSAFIAGWEAKERAGWISWGVVHDGELGGVIEARRLTPIVAEMHCTLKRSFWGQGIGLLAMRMACDQLFEDGAEKLMLIVFSDNHAMLSLLKHLGAKREGTLRKHTRRSGEPADFAVLGIQKEAFYHG